MYTVLKILNNNTLLVKDEKSELIILGKGIGFGRKVQEKFNPNTPYKKYRIETNQQRGNQIVNYIDPIYLEIAAEIMRMTKEHFGTTTHNILLPLADHLYFAIQRIKNNDMPKNPFYNDIQLLFNEEYKVATKAKDVIYRYTGEIINEDEIGFISLHIHSAISVNKVSESMEAMRVIKECFKNLESQLNITIDECSLSYLRLMNHMKFLILRMNTNEALQMDITDFTKERFPFAYHQATLMCEAVSKSLQKPLPPAEIGYLALHLERILSSTIK